MNLNKRVIRIYIPFPYDDAYDDVKLHRGGENINRASKNNLHSGMRSWGNFGRLWLKLRLQLRL